MCTKKNVNSVARISSRASSAEKGEVKKLHKMDEQKPPLEMSSPPPIPMKELKKAEFDELIKSKDPEKGALVKRIFEHSSENQKARYLMYIRKKLEKGIAWYVLEHYGGKLGDEVAKEPKDFIGELLFQAPDQKQEEGRCGQDQRWTKLIMERYDPNRGSLYNFLFTCALNSIRDHLRKKRRDYQMRAELCRERANQIRDELYKEKFAFQDKSFSDRTNYLINHVLTCIEKNLTPTERIALSAKFAAQHNEREDAYKNLAEQLGKSPITLKSGASRGLRKIVDSTYEALGSWWMARKGVGEGKLLSKKELKRLLLALLKIWYERGLLQAALLRA